ncbi:uncharacterized protein PAC_17838 [Phialocephala subalpina]|uniref:Uncharacterized protein n=1 Tax=Phialocephala subalpina TaxID=576137 RepID=A0A1L7XSI2_9HELO|nr:uncharacterized protein PAC_17838 [Phialocephala subalpina]
MRCLPGTQGEFGIGVSTGSTITAQSTRSLAQAEAQLALSSPMFNIDQFDYVFGNAMILTSSSLMYTIDPNTSTFHIYGYTFLIGIGIKSFFTVGFAVVQALLSVSDINNAAGFMSIAQAFGAIALLSIAGSLFQYIGFQKPNPLLPSASAQDPQGLTIRMSSPLFQSFTGDLRHQVIEQVTFSLRNSFTVIIARSALGLLALLFLGYRSVAHGYPPGDNEKWLACSVFEYLNSKACDYTTSAFAAETEIQLEFGEFYGE